MTYDDFFSFDIDKYSFHRPMYEVKGVYQTEKDGKQIVLLNVLGIDEKDIDVSTEYDAFHRQILKIYGKTHDELFDKDYDVSVNFIVPKPMKTIDWKMKNGFMTLEIEYDEPVKPSVKISKK